MGIPEPANFIALEESEIKLDDHVDWIESHHPHVAHIVANLRAMDYFELQSKVRALQACFEFSEKGRGVQWATTIEQHLKVRRSGASRLLASTRSGRSSNNGCYLLDVFGGAGFIAQFARDVFDFEGTVLTSDPSPVMVRLALEKGLPAFWQRAQDLFMTRSNSVDAVLFAYGTHHVPSHERQQSFREAWRVLKPGGVLIFHDFEENTPTARWFQEVVDRYTFTGHNHPHFTTGDLGGYFREAGFDLEFISTIDDCFQFLTPTRDASRRAAIEFMGGAYGLEKLAGSEGASQFLWERIKEIFSVEEKAPRTGSKGGYELVIHRPALLGVGRKPEKSPNTLFSMTDVGGEEILL
jgi:ubiquinone/menaquinone biosynthesis C-methylase UbiE